jgi:hypothetical protein
VAQTVGKNLGLEQDGITIALGLPQRPILFEMASSQLIRLEEPAIYNPDATRSRASREY